MIKNYTEERNIQIIIALLKAHGIKKIVASPGTTNITFVASIQSDPYFEIYSSVDERSAAYIACGLAAESGEPVVLSCTGATASRNYYPGLTEAYYRKLPVLAVTATQNTGRIGHHVPQVIDRTIVANDAAKYSLQVPFVADDTEESVCVTNVNKALLELTRDGGGPVHLNVETRYKTDFTVKELPKVRSIRRYTADDEFPSLPKGRIAVYVGSHRKWSEEECAALDAFCAANDAVVFCDHTSNYKGAYRVLDLLFCTQKQYVSPLINLRLLIHIGEVSGGYPSYFSDEVWRVSPDGEVRDTFSRLTAVFQMSEARFFKQYTADGQKKDSFLNDCKAEYQKLYEKIPELPFGNIWIAKQTAPKLPENSVLHLGILNTLRSWNYFEVPHSVLGYANAGGFGIDGDVSALVGASLADKNKLYFGVFGDLAFFYDMNVLGNHHVGNNVRIMLINNGRGTEFRNYCHKAAQFGEAADAFMAAAGHYGNKSPLLIKHYAEDLGYEYLVASNKDEYLAVYERFILPELTDKPMLFEVFTDSKNESDALKIMHNLVVNPAGSAKKIIKNVLGQENAAKLRHMIGK